MYYQENGAEGNGKVGHVEDAGPQGADAEVEEVHDTETVEQAIDEVSQTPAHDGRDEDYPDPVRLFEHRVVQAVEASRDGHYQEKSVLDGGRPVSAKSQEGTFVLRERYDHGVLHERYDPAVAQVAEREDLGQAISQVIGGYAEDRGDDKRVTSQPGLLQSVWPYQEGVENTVDAVDQHTTRETLPVKYPWYGLRQYTGDSSASQAAAAGCRCKKVAAPVIKSTSFGLHWEAH